MPNWGPSWWGRVFCRSEEWRLHVDADSIRVIRGSKARSFALTDSTVEVEEGAWWGKVTIVSGPTTVTLLGMPNGQTDGLRAAVGAALTVHMEASGLAERFAASCADIVAWQKALSNDLAGWRNRWVTREFVREWHRSRPTVDKDFQKVLDKPRFKSLVDAQPAGTLKAIEMWQGDLQTVFDARNETFLRDERNRYQDFFRTIESSPLTEEQIKAVVCFDSRVQVIASAGSGKTSTIIAKAGYALHRQIVPADRILMLAFNKEAAGELGERVQRRLGAAAVHGGNQVSTNTFHAFGLSVIGEALGRKPRLPQDLGDGNGEKRVRVIVDELRSRDLAFRATWGLFCVVFGKDLPPFDQAGDEPAELATFKGDIVKSHEEQMIANWLYFNGVNYEYERDYEYRTADPLHGQYRPDFYYPDIDTYHEHWALGRDGKAPPQFKDYAAGVTWKRSTHRANRTPLLETTSATVRDGTAFDYLQTELTRRGITLRPNPELNLPDRVPMRDGDLVNLVRTFMIHVKSNQLTHEQLEQRISRSQGSAFRARLFLHLVNRIFDVWQQRLEAAEQIDFEDMLNRAADLIETGKWDSPYRLVMVDEMQDASHARARLVRALVNKPGVLLFAVGDDWQSINRFAGADLSVMTRFDDWFGTGTTLRLQRTFRSPQSICDVSSAFVTKNPAQLSKRVLSGRPEFPPALTAVAVRANTQYAPVIEKYLTGLDTAIRTGTITPGRDGRTSVHILGRYRKVKEAVQPILDRTWGHLDVTFNTMHGAKGKEADYVILAGMVRRGMPSTIEDDPLLQLAMPAGDTYTHAEERRLFYVAMTRTKRSVLMLTVEGQESPFLIELIKDGQLTLESAAGEDIPIVLCRKCGVGRTVKRNGPYGEFYSCSTYPECDGKIRNRSRR